MAGFRPAALGSAGPGVRPGETGTLVLDADAAGVAAVVPCAVMMSLSRKCLSVSWRGKPDGSVREYTPAPCRLAQLGLRANSGA